MRETVQQLLDRLKLNEIVVAERAIGPHDEDAFLKMYKYSSGEVIKGGDNSVLDELVDSYYLGTGKRILVVYIVTDWMKEAGYV